MAVIYLRSSDGSDASDGLTWANAKATLAAALTAAGAGGTVYVSDNHAESSGSAITLTSPGTAAAPVTVLCVNDASDPEPPTALAATASVAGLTLAVRGFAYCYGITFNASSTGSSTTIAFFGDTLPGYWRLENCVVALTGNSATPRLLLGAVVASHDDELVEFVNTTLSFAHVGQAVNPISPFIMRGGAVTGTAPTTLFVPSTTINGKVILQGVDLSGLGSGKNLVDVSIAKFQDYLFENCKLGASVAITTGANSGQGGVTIQIINCDSGDTNYRYVKHCYQGDITQESTIVRTGGASDGTTPISRKMVSSANSKFYSPLELGPLSIWNEATGSSKTLTVEVVTDNVTLTDAEAWVEVEYLGTSGFPLSLFANDRAADVLATPANQTSSSETWTTTGLGTPVKQKLAVSFTPQEKGLIRARVMLAKASTTMYVCPKVTIS